MMMKEDNNSRQTELHARQDLPTATCRTHWTSRTSSAILTEPRLRNLVAHCFCCCRPPEKKKTIAKILLTPKTADFFSALSQPAATYSHHSREIFLESSLNKQWSLSLPSEEDTDPSFPGRKRDANNQHVLDGFSLGRSAQLDFLSARERNRRKSSLSHSPITVSKFSSHSCSWFIENDSDDGDSFHFHAEENLFCFWLRFKCGVGGEEGSMCIPIEWE